MRLLLLVIAFSALLTQLPGQILLVDDFESDANTNRLGGTWGTFSAGGDRYFSMSLRELGNAGRALDTVGSFPRTQEGTYGGIFCELSAEKATTVDLTPYTHLVFDATALRPAVTGFGVRIENPTDEWRAPLRTFQAGPAPTTVRVPLAGLPSLDKANAIAWTSADALQGAPFGLRLDNVRFERIDPATDARQAYYTDFTRAVQAHHREGKPLVAFVYQKGVGKSDEVLEALLHDRTLSNAVKARIVLLLIDAERSPELMTQLKIIRLPSLVAVPRPNATPEVIYISDGLVTVHATFDEIGNGQRISANTTH